jgi:hypothetical protein
LVDPIAKCGVLVPFFEENIFLKKVARAGDAKHKKSKFVIQDNSFSPSLFSSHFSKCFTQSPGPTSPLKRYNTLKLRSILQACCLPTSRVTRFICNKIAQNVAQAVFCQNKNTTLTL